MLEYILGTVILTLCAAIAVRYVAKARNDPPGPKGYPYFGVVSEVDIHNLHHKLHEWAQKFGDVFQFQILGQRFVCINSTEVLRETFLKEPNATITADRPRTFVGKYIMDGYADLVSASPSAMWTRRRKFIYRLLHTYGEGLESLESQVMQNMLKFKDNVRNISEIDVNPCSLVDEFVLGTVEFLLIGQSFGKEGDLQRLLKEENDLGNRAVHPGTDAVYSALPFLRFLPLQATLDFAQVMRTHQEVLDKLDSLLKEDDCYKKGIYYTLKETMKEKDENGKSWFTDKNLSGFMYNLVGAGYLTTRATLLSIIQILAKRPDLQKSLQKEVDGVIGQDREPRLSDRENCPLLEAVVMETLRYISHVPVFILHATSQSTIIGGYNVAKGTLVVPNSWSMHHSERYWEEPFSFKPERFLNKEGRLLSANHPVRKRLAVFGKGKRSCIGEVFAKSRTFLFLSSLMQITTIAKPDYKPLSDLDPRTMLPGVVLQPQEYEVRFVLRSQFKNE